ncbi:MAG TPA: GntR family transcriptional regulator [Paracoccus sp.]|nr:GntR family transcriptional regulator [Paracoccus sp. (in: a-proteobacteria)]
MEVWQSRCRAGNRKMDQRPRINPGISTAQQVHDWLHDLILRGDLLPGTQLSESEIAGRVGVSRQPVREAFIRLAGAGLTEVRPQRGTFIGRISLREVLAVRAIREAVESDMIRILTQRMTDDIHRDLREQLDRQRAAAARRDVNGFVLLDNLFHRTLATAADAAFPGTVLALAVADSLVICYFCWCSLGVLLLSLFSC